MFSVDAVLFMAAYIHIPIDKQNCTHSTQIMAGAKKEVSRKKRHVVEWVSLAYELNIIEKSNQIVH